MELFLSFMKRKEILALCASNPEAIVAYIESQESQIKESSERLKAFEARLNQNSRNSSKPPSTDFYVKEKPNPKRSRRQKSDKKPGGQEGHLGTTLEMVDNPDEVIEHSLSYCEECGCTLESIEVEAYERRQIFDIPPVTLIVT